MIYPMAPALFDLWPFVIFGALKPKKFGPHLRPRWSRRDGWGGEKNHIFYSRDTGNIWISYLVGGAITILKNMLVNGKDDIPYMMENKKCSKPPTRYDSLN